MLKRLSIIELWIRYFELIVVYLHSNVIRLRWIIGKPWQIFSNEKHRSRDQKIDIDFSTFRGFFSLKHK